MTSRYDIDQVVTALGSLAGSQFYGTMSIQLVAGEAVIIRVEQTIKIVKPSAKPPKPFKQMTGDEYRKWREEHG